tara:strand:- start:132 stop:422 length:291 start_codon:yes stop_codon:yes gene_type:complete
MATIAAKLGLSHQVEKPEIDARTNFWLQTYSLAERGRPYTQGIPLPLPPLDIIALVRQLEMPAGAAESVAVVSAMDDAWIKWKDSKQSKPRQKAKR